MSAHAACPKVPVSWGELLDKITILLIKSERIRNPAARRHVERELACLVDAAGPTLANGSVAPLLRQLKRVNETLWTIEDSIREREAEHDFGTEFITLARAVYKKNDERAAIKRQINHRLGSELVEQKSYSVEPK